MHLRPSGGIGIDGWILTAGYIVVLWAIAALMVLGLFRYLHKIPYVIPYVHDDALAPDLVPEAVSASTATPRSPE